jgi:CheY-like chemotaxis protein
MQNPHKILIVDDDPEDQETLMEIIEDLYPLSVKASAMNGAEAIQYIEKNPPPPSLVFLDLNMPLVNGFDFLKIYKKKPGYENSFVIIYSTSSRHHDKSLAHELGASGFIIKSYDSNSVRKKIIEIVEQIESL